MTTALQVPTTCIHCGKPYRREDNYHGETGVLMLACSCRNGLGFWPPPKTEPRTADEVVARLRRLLPRDWHGGECLFCGTSMYADGETADTHEPGCVWVMAHNVAEARG
jgi:hypothetical protein